MLGPVEWCLWISVSGVKELGVKGVELEDSSVPLPRGLFLDDIYGSAL